MYTSTGELFIMTKEQLLTETIGPTQQLLKAVYGDDI